MFRIYFKIYIFSTYREGKNLQHAVWLYGGKGTTDAIFIVSQLQEKHSKEKRTLNGIS